MNLGSALLILDIVTPVPNVVDESTVLTPTKYSLSRETPKPISESKVFFAKLYFKDTPLPVLPIPIPAPSSKVLFGTVDAIPTTKSASLMVSESTINLVPSTYKSPLILTIPLVVPTPIGRGSIIIFSGPKIVAVFSDPPPILILPPTSSLTELVVFGIVEPIPTTPSLITISSLTNFEVEKPESLSTAEK